MSKAKQTLAQAFLERVSRGAVPMGGFYWIDPKDLRGRAVAERDVTGRDVAAPKSAAHGLYAAAAGERS